MCTAYSKIGYKILIKIGCTFAISNHLFDACTSCVSESVIFVPGMNIKKTT